MNVVYLLIPLIWLNGLAAGKRLFPPRSGTASRPLRMSHRLGGLSAPAGIVRGVAVEVGCLERDWMVSDRELASCFGITRPSCVQAVLWWQWQLVPSS